MKIVRENILVEKSINDIELSDIINSKTMDHYLDDTFNNELLMHSYANEMGLDPEELGDSDDWSKTEDARDFIRYEIQNLAEETIYKFKYGIIGNKKEIPIWRAITVPKDWISHLEREGMRLGHYWSYDPDGAETHWGDYSRSHTAIIESSIKEEYIDWVDTIRLNMSPISSGEREIRLFKNTPLKVNRIWIDGEEVELSDTIKNKTFRA